MPLDDLVSPPSTGTFVAPLAIRMATLPLIWSLETPPMIWFELRSKVLLLAENFSATCEWAHPMSPASWRVSSFPWKRPEVMLSPHEIVLCRWEGRKRTGIWSDSKVAVAVAWPSRGSIPPIASVAWAVAGADRSEVLLDVCILMTMLTFAVAWALIRAKVVVMVLPATLHTCRLTEVEHFTKVGPSGSVIVTITPVAEKTESSLML